MVETEREVQALPELSPRSETEPIEYYGFRVLTFILQTDCYATVSEADLELAHAAAHRAVGGPLDETARSRIVTVRRTIVRVLADRAAYRAACARDTVPADPDVEAITEGAQGLGALSQSDQALKLLRAALTLILDDQTDDPGAGRSRVPTHPKPSAPAPGTQLPAPRTDRSMPDIAF